MECLAKKSKKYLAVIQKIFIFAASLWIYCSAIYDTVSPRVVIV